MIEATHPSAIDVAGKPYLHDAKGNLVPLASVKAADLLMDETVRSILVQARAVSELISTFKSDTFESVGDLQALIAQNSGRAEHQHRSRCRVRGAASPGRVAGAGRTGRLHGVRRSAARERAVAR